MAALYPKKLVIDETKKKTVDNMAIFSLTAMLHVSGKSKKCSALSGNRTMVFALHTLLFRKSSVSPVKRVINKEKELVRIEWHESCLGEGDEKVTIQQLKANKWNPKKPREGAWRQYLTK